jgi:hypothetical protein
MKRSSKSTAFSPLAFLLAALVAGFAGRTPVVAQQASPVRQAPPPMQTPSDQAGGATIYLDFPLSRLKESVPQLKGLHYDAAQQQLPAILAGVANRIAEVMTKLPNLASREDVYHFQSPRDAFSDSGLAGSQPWNRQFRYLLLSHHSADGSNRFEEQRTDGKGRPVEASVEFTAPRGLGFAYQWLFFSADNQPEFRFRWLGRQEKEGRKTFVIAFAQVPGKVANPAYFQALGKTAPFYFQGVLWVDQATFDIVKLRTDLLAPLPDLHLRQLTTDLTFRSVAIHGYDAVFWLPGEVYISCDQGTGPSEESHRYSDYHLYHAEVRIVDSP